MEYIAPIAILGILGFLFGVGLSYALKVFAVKEDPMVAKVLAILPGTNCGACGFGGCKVYAESLASGETTDSNLCKPGAEPVAKALADLMGLQFKSSQKSTAVVHCGAEEAQRTKAARYHGYRTCAAANLVGGAGTGCSWGCIGFGDCQRACPFGAIDMINGLAVIDPARCTSCGKCVAACPRQLISVQPISEDGLVVVSCRSHDQAKKTREVCGVGCIACTICVKVTDGLFKIEDNLAWADRTKGGPKEAYDQAVAKCPRKIIRRIV